MHPKTNRRVKKREKEGGINLPLIKVTLRGDDRCETAGENNQGLPRDKLSSDIQGDPVRAGSEGQGEGKTDLSLEHGGADASFPRTPSTHSADLRHTYESVVAEGLYNFAGARCRVPSGLNIEAWKRYLADYDDKQLLPMLEYGWPINFDRSMPLQSTLQNHASAMQYEGDIEHYIATELAHNALLGPFNGAPVKPTHISPLMT